MFYFQGQSHEEDGEEAGGDEQDESPAPARLLGHPADDGVGQQEGAEEIAEEARKACRLAFVGTIGR